MFTEQSFLIIKFKNDYAITGKYANCLNAVIKLLFSTKNYSDYPNILLIFILFYENNFFSVWWS